MPVQYTMPPDTRAVGTGNPPSDVNAHTDALAAMGATFNVLNAAYAGGADPTGAADSQPAFAAAIASLPAAGGTITVPAGTYKLNSTVTVTVAPTASVRIIGAGLESTILSYAGTGDAIRMRASSFTGGWAQGCELAGFTVDGTSAGAASNGLHIGDINAARVNIQVSNFTGAGSAGILFENTTTWTEQGDYRAILNNCTQGVVFTKSGSGTNSFGYGNYDFTLWTVIAGQDGIVFSNAITVYHSVMCVRGNFGSSSSPLTNAVLRFTGTSFLSACHLDVQVECPTGTNRPTTIIMDAGSQIRGCYGILDFSGGAGTFVPTPAALNQVTFTGILSGDVNLNPAALYNVWVAAAVNFPQVLSVEPSGYHGSGFPTCLADVFTWTLSANLTANLTSTFFNSTKTLGAAQRVTIIIKQAAAGGPYTVTWPVSGTPTTALPTIQWAGGTVPVMSTAANAVDVYDLETADGATWYGVARQANAGSGGVPDEPSWLPSDAGFLASTYDPAAATATFTMASGTVYLFRVNVRAALTCTNVISIIGTAGSGLTSGQNFAGLYTSTGTRVGITADQTTPWATAGLQTMTLAGGPFALSAGFYWMAMLAVGTTPPVVLSATSTFRASNAGTAVSVARYAINGTGATALPASITPASNSLLSPAVWAAIS